MSRNARSIPLSAGAAITARRIVKIGAADNTVIQGAAAGDTLLGVSEFDMASGEMATVQIGGVATVEAGAAVTRGSLVTTDSVGRGVAAAPALGVNNGFVGIALEAAAAAGDYFEVAIAPGSRQG